MSSTSEPKSEKSQLTKKQLDARSRKMNPNDPSNKKKAPSGRKKKSRPSRSMAGQTRTVSEPVAKNRGYRGGAPRYTYEKNGDVTVEHTEFVSDVITTGTSLLNAGGNGGLDYTISSLDPANGEVSANGFGNNALNPGNIVLCQALTAIAENYEMYQFEEVDLIYSQKVSTTAGGEILLAWDPDPDDHRPANKREMLDFAICVGIVAHEDAKIRLPRQPVPLFINRTVNSDVNNVGYDAEPRTANYGKLFVAGNNLPINVFLGDLMIRYRCKFSKFQNRPQLQIMSLTAGNLAGTAAGTSASKPLGAAGSLITQTGPSRGVSLIEDNAIAAPKSGIRFDEPGEYMVTVNAAGTGLDTPQVTMTSEVASDYVLVNANPGTTFIGSTTAGITNIVGQFLLKVVHTPVIMNWFFNSVTTIVSAYVNVGRLYPGTVGLSTGLVAIGTAMSLPDPGPSASQALSRKYRSETPVSQRSNSNV
jgi:hypothetical protein